MGREIRMVPQGWEHPKNEKGHYIPMLDKTWEEALTDWLKEKEEWDNDQEERVRVLEKYGIASFAEWHGNPPGYEYHRPAFTSEPDHYQIYETVSEGTPVSPVFETKEDMRIWLLEQGFSENAVDRFLEFRWAPSFVMDSRGVSGIGIHSLDFYGGEDED